MRTSTLSDPSASDSVASLGQKTEKETEYDSQKRLEEKFKATSSQIFDLLSEAVGNRVLTAGEREEYMKGISMKNLEAGGATTLEKKNEWLEENLQRYAPQFIEKARSSINAFLSDIATAQQNGWITTRSAERWYQRLYERSSSSEETKEFLQKFNEKYMANWRRLAEKKSEMQKKKEKLKVTAKQVPELAVVEAKGFDDLPYPEKAEKIFKALAALGVYEKNNQLLTRLYAVAKDKLQVATKTPKVMRDDQAAEWLESLFNRDRTPTEVQAILSGKLTEYISNWTQARFRYDRLTRRMKSEGIPPGVVQHDEKSFLNLTWPEKQSYVQETEYAMNLLEKGFSNKPIDKMKLEIRSLIAQKDWIGAKAIIAKAYKEAEMEDIYELQSMERAIQLGMPAEEVEEPEQSAAEILDDMRTALFEVPPSVRGLYIQALQAGPQVFSSLCTLFYNRVWCWNNGYLDDEIESGSRQKAQMETKEIIQNGHRPKGLENIDIDTVDETQKGEAMRPYEKTWAPTIIHLDASNGSSCGALVNELRGKVEARDYWSTLVLKNISYEKQRELVMGVNYRLKSGIRKLAAAGHGFSLVGKV